MVIDKAVINFSFVEMPALCTFIKEPVFFRICQRAFPTTNFTHMLINDLSAHATLFRILINLYPIMIRITLFPTGFTAAKKPIMVRLFFSAHNTFFHAFVRYLLPGMILQRYISTFLTFQLTFTGNRFQIMVGSRHSTHNTFFVTLFLCNFPFVLASFATFLTPSIYCPLMLLGLGFAANPAFPMA